MQKCNPSRTSTRVYNWPKHQIKGAASASKLPLEFLCHSVQGDETTQGFNFHFKPTKSPFLIFSLSYREPIRVLALPGTRAPIPPPPLTWGAMEDIKLLLAGIATAFPGCGLAEELCVRVWGVCRTEWNSFQLSRASHIVMKIASCRAAVTTSKDSFQCRQQPLFLSCVAEYPTHTLCCTDSMKDKVLEAEGTDSFVPAEVWLLGVMPLLNMEIGAWCLDL